MDSLAKRIAWAIETIKKDESLDKGIKDVDLAKNLGTNKNTLAAYRNNQGILKGEVVERIVSRYHFVPGWLFHGEGEPFPGARQRYPDVCGAEVKTTESSEFVFIPQMSGHICAGTGLEPDNTSDIRVAFRDEWIRKKGDSHAMSLITVRGDSMEPTLLQGDVVLINHNHKHVSPQGGIYAISLQGEIVVKRIQISLPDKNLKITSDNKHYDPITANEIDVQINGKVIWYGREIER